MATIGLVDGTRVAVVGAGPSGAAFASALLASARAFARRVEVVLYDGGGAQRALAAPALLDMDTRYRLAALGAPIPLRQGALEARGLLVHSGGREVLLEPPPAGLWVLDGVSGAPGTRLVKQVLLSAASLRGATVRPWHVDSVSQAGQRYVVRAQGSAESFDLVVGAFGSTSPLAAGWMEGRLRVRRGLCTQARLSGAPRDDLLRVFVAPSRRVDLLTLVPCPSGESWALAMGEDVPASELARTLAELARDGALPAVSLRRVERVATTWGAARHTCRGSQLALGAAAHGSVLTPGLLPSLLGAMRASNAVVEAGAGLGLPSRFETSQREVSEHARQQAKALWWARQAGPRTPAAFSSAVMAPGQLGGLPVLGLSSLNVLPLLAELRGQALRQWWDALWSRRKAGPAHVPAGSLVYVVDDDADARGALVEFLQRRGTRVRAFEDELSLLEAAARERPAAVLLDVVLRWVDGLSLCRALRGHPATARSRLISMSGLNRRSDRDAALASGADAFLAKPIDVEELERALAGVLRPPSGGAAVAQTGSG
ncbi:MAG TPA: response regulator [Myxococcales bacterium]